MSKGSPGPFAPGSECMSVRPAISGVSGTCPSAISVHKLALVTRARVRGPALSTNSPGRLGSWSEAPRSTSCPDDSGQCPISHWVDQLSRTKRALVGGAVVSTTGPGRLVLGSEGPRGRPDVFGDWDQVPMICGFDQVSRVTRALAGALRGQADIPGASGPAPST